MWPALARAEVDYLDNPAPVYPLLSQDGEEEGRVVLRVYVDSTGMAGKVEVASSSGFERLDTSAVAAVRRWKFIPAKRGDNVIGAWVLIPIIFSLNG